MALEKNNSTCIVLLNLVDQVSNELYKKQFSIGVYIDLSKAFDTLDHQILLTKLNNYGINGMANSWFSNYVENKKQIVSIVTDFSDTRVIKSDVPQGSNPGLLLLIIIH